MVIAGLLGLLLVSPVIPFVLDPLTKVVSRLIILEEILPKVGDALIIAVVLAFLVDVAAKQELLREFLTETSAHIIGRQLPEDIREEIRAYLSADFIRPSWSLIYELREVPGDEGAIALQSRYVGEIQNRSTKTLQHHFIAEVDDTWLQGVGKSQILRVAYIRGADTIFHEVFTENSPQIVTDKGVKRFSRFVDVQPRPVGSYTTILECLEFLPSSYVYPMIAATTVSSTELTVYYDKRKLKVAVTLSSGDEDKIERLEFENCTTWKIKSVLLPGQCVMTNWQRIVVPADTQFEAKPLAN